MSKGLVVVLLLSSFQLVRVASYRLTISPEHVRVSTERPESISVTCTADAALTGCQFGWWDQDGKAGPLLELSRGSESQANSTHLNSALTGYTYTGRGLGAGDCGVSLKVEGSKTWLIACRVRAETGGWTYAWADLYASSWDQLPHTLTPRESVILPGGEARFMLKVPDTLDWCRFYPSGLILSFMRGPKSSDSTSRHRYLGSGLGSGECGLALTHVSEVDNGPLGGYIQNSKWRPNDDFRFMALIVAHPPTAPALSVVYTDARVTATCVVHDGRPVANITWVLGDVVLRKDSLDDHPGNAQDEWRWPWMKGSVVQRLTLSIQAKYNGKVLKCVASHVALAQPLEATEIISFTESASETTPLATTSTTVETSTTAPSPCTCHNAHPTCTATSTLEFLWQEYRVRASQLGNTSSCPRDKFYEFHVREARAAARAAEIMEEQAMVTLNAAQANLEAAKFSLKAEEARANREEARAKKAEQELQLERERRSQSLHQRQNSESVQG